MRVVMTASAYTVTQSPNFSTSVFLLNMFVLLLLGAAWSRISGTQGTHGFVVVEDVAPPRRRLDVGPGTAAPLLRAGTGHLHDDMEGFAALEMAVATRGSHLPSHGVYPNRLLWDPVFTNGVVALLDRHVPHQ